MARVGSQKPSVACPAKRIEGGQEYPAPPRRQMHLPDPSSVLTPAPSGTRPVWRSFGSSQVRRRKRVGGGDRLCLWDFRHRERQPAATREQAVSVNQGAVPMMDTSAPHPWKLYRM